MGVVRGARWIAARMRRRYDRQRTAATRWLRPLSRCTSDAASLRERDAQVALAAVLVGEVVAKSWRK
jgi:hypothetical protein